MLFRLSCDVYDMDAIGSLMIWKIFVESHIDDLSVLSESFLIQVIVTVFTFAFLVGVVLFLRDFLEQRTSGCVEGF